MRPIPIKVVFPSDRIWRSFMLRMYLPLMALTPHLHVSGQSLYSEKEYRPLASDHKAFRAGDILTVHVYEKSSAATTTDTSTQRNNNITGAFDTNLFGGKHWEGSISSGGTFDGGGTTQRTNRLLAALSVGVIEVLPNGDLKVAGEQLLTVNGEQHKVLVEGKVRPMDISSDNVVLSTRLAEAKINYIGEGDLSQRQKRAWWRAFLDWVGF